MGKKEVTPRERRQWFSEVQSASKERRERKVPAHIYAGVKRRGVDTWLKLYSFQESSSSDHGKDPSRDRSHKRVVTIREHENKETRRPRAGSRPKRKRRPKARKNVSVNSHIKKDRRQGKITLVYCGHGKLLSQCSVCGSARNERHSLRRGSGTALALTGKRARSPVLPRPNTYADETRNL